MKKSKDGKSCGFDMIDGQSLKAAAPLIEDSLLHIINLSILTNEFARREIHY